MRIACDGLVTSQGWTTPGCQRRSCLRRALTRGPAMDPSVVGEMWQRQTCVQPVSRRRNGTTLLRTGGSDASVAVGSHQANPNQECSSVSAAATFAIRMIYPDTRTTASPNSYHRLWRWAFQRSKGVCVCVQGRIQGGGGGGGGSNKPPDFSDHSSGVTTNPCPCDMRAPCYGPVGPGQSGLLAMQLGRST